MEGVTQEEVLERANAFIGYLSNLSQIVRNGSNSVTTLENWSAK